MYKVLITVISFLFVACTSHRHVADFQCKKIEKVFIIDSATGDKWTIDDIDQICPLFEKYLSTAKKRLFKFRAIYTLNFSCENQEWVMSANANHVKINGITYALDYDLEDYIRNHLHTNEFGNDLAQYDSLTHRNVYTFVEKMPRYKGGQSFLNDFGKIFHLSSEAHEEMQTKLRVQFVITKEGQLIGARICDKSEEEYTGFEKDGLKTLNSMQNWEAGMHNNKAVDVLLTMVIHVDYNR